MSSLPRTLSLGSSRVPRGGGLRDKPREHLRGRRKRQGFYRRSSTVECSVERTSQACPARKSVPGVQIVVGQAHNS